MSRNITDLPLFYELPLRPDFSAETRLLAAGCRYVAGVDEVGRGPLAGPVVTAAVILDAAHIPAGLNDSKKLSAKMRARLYEEILQKAIAVSIASLSASAIDRTDIRKAALEAMRRSVAGLAIQPQYVLVDGRDIPPGLPCSADALIKGDQRSVSIAAASIVAKVVRDRMMERAGIVYPAYGFEKHAGYATVIHRTAIEEQGPVKGLHRYSFAPVKGRFTENLS